MRLAVALWPYWDLRWRERFAVAYLTRLLGQQAAALTDNERAWALTVMVDLAANPGEVRLARQPADDAVALFRELGEPRGLCAALIARAYVHRDEGTLDLAENVLAEARTIADRLDDQPLLGRAEMTAWAIASRRGSDQAERLAREELARFTALGGRRSRVTAMRHLAVTLRDQGDLDGATRLCEQVLAVWEELRERPAVAHAQTTSPTSPASAGTGTGRPPCTSAPSSICAPSGTGAALRRPTGISPSSPRRGATTSGARRAAP